MTKSAQRNVFYGRYIEQMPLLVNQGLQPYTSKDVMQRRVEALQHNDKDEISFWLNSYWHNSYWHTSDGLAYHKGNLIVAPDSELLRNITPNPKLRNGALVLTLEQYIELFKQHEFIRRDKVILGKPLTKEQAKKHALWIKLAQEDRALLNEYVDLIFAKAREVYGRDENMGFYLQNDQEDPLMRAWGHRDLYDGSDADARISLDEIDTRLFGVRAQNLEALLGNIAVELGITNLDDLKRAIQLYQGAKEGSIDLKLLQ